MAAYAISEEFPDFITIERITGEALATAILRRLCTWGVDVSVGVNDMMAHPTRHQVGLVGLKYKEGFVRLRYLPSIVTAKHTS